MNTPSKSVKSVQLNRQIDAAERNLLLQRRQQQDQTGDDVDIGMGVIFTGNFHHSIPHNLLFDPVLTPADKTFWMILRANITNPQAPGYVPSREELAIAMNCSQPTISRARATLRIGRWMTYLRTVRDDGKRFVGDIYLLHEEPLSLADTLELDEAYIRFLEDQARGSSTSKNNRQLASSVLAEVGRLRNTPVSPTQREILEQRLHVASNLPSMDYRNSLSFAFGEDDSFSHDETASSNTLASRSKNFTPAFQVKLADNHENSADFSTQSKNFAADELSQSKNFSAGAGQVKNFTVDRSSSGCSSSYINNKYISTRAHEGNSPSKSHQDSRDIPDASLSEHIPFRPDIPIREEVANALRNNHMEFLVTPETLPRLFVWTLHLSHIPVVGRKILCLDDSGKREVTYQLFGRLVASHSRKADPIQNIVGFAHALITRYQDGEFALDEWGVLARDVIEERMPWYLSFDEATDPDR